MPELVINFKKCAYCQEERLKLKEDIFCSKRCKFYFDELPYFWRNYIKELFKPGAD